MNPLRKLANQTAIYGIGHVLGKLLYFFLLPVYTGIFQTHEFGALSLLFSYVAFANIVFTYGFETSFFKALSTHDNEEEVYSTSNISLIASSILFGTIIIFFNQEIANYFNINNHPEFINWLVYIIVFDTIATIPLAYLRHIEKAQLFSKIKLINIFVQIGFNLLFLLPVLIPQNSNEVHRIFGYTYNPEINIGYVLLANLIGSAVTILLLSGYLLKIKLKFNLNLWKEMIQFSYPLVIVGLAAMTNEMIDRILLKELLPGNSEENNAMIGIYAACYKIAMFITIANTAFRQAAEPFFFSQHKEKNSNETYGLILKYYTIMCALLFLGIMLYIDIIKDVMLHEKFHEGIIIVPIILLANVFSGINYNLSIWYKLGNKTIFGSYIAIVGALITLTLNFLLIPYIGYIGSAWATLICYLSMVIISYFWGQKHYPIKYNVRKIGFYLALSVGLYYFSLIFNFQGWLHYLINTSLLISYILLVLYIEKPQKYLS